MNTDKTVTRLLIIVVGFGGGYVVLGYFLGWLN